MPDPQEMINMEPEILEAPPAKPPVESPPDNPADALPPKDGEALAKYIRQVDMKFAEERGRLVEQQQTLQQSITEINALKAQLQAKPEEAPPPVESMDFDPDDFSTPERAREVLTRKMKAIETSNDRKMQDLEKRVETLAEKKAEERVSHLSLEQKKQQLVRDADAFKAKFKDWEKHLPRMTVEIKTAEALDVPITYEQAYLAAKDFEDYQTYRKAKETKNSPAPPGGVNPNRVKTPTTNPASVEEAVNRAAATLRAQGIVPPED